MDKNALEEFLLLNYNSLVMLNTCEKMSLIKCFEYIDYQELWALRLSSYWRMMEAYHWFILY